jgi:hypothetical protein
VLATPFASTDRAYALKISHDLWLELRDFPAIEMNFVHPPVQQVRSIRPFAGENGEIGSTHAYVAGNAFHVGRTATFEIQHRLASAVPISPPACKPADEGRPFTYFSRVRHGNLHADQRGAPMH